MKQFIVAVPKESDYYFETAEAAETYAIKIKDAIVVYDVEGF